MKKIVLVLAIAGAYSTGASAASPFSPDSQDSASSSTNLQLYGTIDLGFRRFTGLKPGGTNPGAGTASTSGVGSGLGQPSRIGLKGTEDLGGGNRVFFVAETGFCAAGLNQSGTDSSGFCSGGFMQRQSYVGWAGGAGQLTAGRQYTVLELQEMSIDPFGTGYTGSFDNLSVVGAGSFLGRDLSRLSQSVSYSTPDFGPVGATVQYSFNSANSAPLPLGSDRPTAVMGDLHIGQGPLVAGLSYARYANSVLATDALSNQLGGYRIGVAYGSYDFGAVKLGAMYQRATASGWAGYQDAWLVGASAPLGPGLLMASYAQHDTSLGPQGTSFDTSKARQLAVGYRYDLSKRTSLYTSYAHLTNAASGPNATGTSFAVGDATDRFGGVIGQDSNGFALGITHSF